MCGVNGNTMEIFRKNLKSLIHEKNLKSKVRLLLRTPEALSRPLEVFSWQSSQHLNLFFSRRNWDSIHSLTLRRVRSPLLWFGGGGTHLLAGEGVGGPNANEGTDTVVLYVYK
jgi:hypothetical protein